MALVVYAAKAAQSWGWPWSPESSAAAAIPLVAFWVWRAMRRLHRRLGRGGMDGS